MDTGALFSYWACAPLAWLGLTSKFWHIHLDTLIYTWIAMAILFAVVWLVRKYYFSENSLVYTAAEGCIESFATMCAESIGYFRYDYFSFITTMFLFTFFCCIVSMLPYVEEATKDANTTFALGIASFLYVSYQQIWQEGVVVWLKHFLGHEEMPMIMRIVMAPLETMGQFSRIISMGFRLFGNILGGAVVYHVLLSVTTYYQTEFVWLVTIGGLLWFTLYKVFRIELDSWGGRKINQLVQILFVVTWVQIFFGIFEALIQSFVIAMLSITYLSLSVHHDLKKDAQGVAWNS